VDASEVCIFEMQDRVGGRAYSLRGLGPEKDLSVDAGAYRTVSFVVFFDFEAFFKYLIILPILLPNYSGLNSHQRCTLW